LIAAYEYDYKLRHGQFLACPVNPSDPSKPWNPNAQGWKELGFEPKGVHNYSYEVTLTEKSFKVQAVGNIDGDPDQDVWTLDGGNLELKNEKNDV